MNSDLEQAAQGAKNGKSRKLCEGRALTAVLIGLLCLLTAGCAVLSTLLFFNIGSTDSPKVSTLKLKSQVKEQLADKCPEVCLTEHCVAAAASIIKIMDKKADPCNDFYQFACGKWKRTYPLPEDKIAYDTFSRLREDVQMALKGILESPIDSVETCNASDIAPSDCNVIASVKNLYRSCVNITIIESRGEEPLKDLVTSLGGWPMLDTSWNETAADLSELVANLKTYNNDVLFSLWVGADSKNSTNNILQIDQPDLPFPSREYYLKKDEKILTAYQTYIRGVARLLGANSLLVDLDSQGILGFEIQLANISKPAEERRDVEALYKKMEISDLKAIAPQIDWNKYFNVINQNLTDDEPIIIFATDYLVRLNKLLSRTSKRVVTNYAMWRFIQNRVVNLDSRFLQLRQNYLQILYGRQRQPDRWRECITYVNSNLGMVVGAMFVKDNFNNESKELAEEMIATIRTSFLELLDDVDWMDSETKKVAREKALLISEKVGYPDYVTTPGWMASHYKDLDFKENVYFENVLKNLRHLAKLEQEKLRVPHLKSLWSTTPAVVNAFYNRAKNQITFPAGILQPPFFSQHYPRSLNYGAIGVVIGHELTHGFDDRGRQFDQDGNLVQWWHEEAIKRFQKKVECVIKQYSNYTVPEINLQVNGFTTQGENIADNGGIKQAFRAFKKWVDQHGNEPLLPGIVLNHDQLFFVSFAQVWCGIMRPEAAISKVRSGPHSPGMFRVIGTLSNSYDFAKTFKCPVGSPMNPPDKCVVW